MLSPPEKKQCNIFVEDYDLKPCFLVGEYGKVVADTSPGTNRPEGCGCITSVRGFGAATLSDVQYDKAYDNERMHKNISAEHLTIFVFGVEFIQPGAVRDNG